MGLGVRGGKRYPMWWQGRKRSLLLHKQPLLWGEGLELFSVIPSENPVMIPLIIQDSPKSCLKGSLPH